MERKFNKFFILLFISVISIGFDRATKFLARRLLEPGSVIKLFGDIIRIQLANNKGAFLGMGSSLSDEWRFWIFTVVVAVSLLILFFYYLFSKSLSKSSTIGLSLIMSGGLSNLIDRIIHDGIVVDFLNIGIGNLRTGILNIADIAITFGIILMLYAFLTKKRGEADLINISKIN